MVTLVSTAKNLGVALDSQLFKAHIAAAVTRSCRFALQHPMDQTLLHPGLSPAPHPVVGLQKSQTYTEYKIPPYLGA